MVSKERDGRIGPSATPTEIALCSWALLRRGKKPWKLISVNETPDAWREGLVTSDPARPPLMIIGLNNSARCRLIR
jgi:hypothetical protein